MMKFLINFHLFLNIPKRLNLPAFQLIKAETATPIRPPRIILGLLILNPFVFYVSLFWSSGDLTLETALEYASLVFSIT